MRGGGGGMRRGVRLRCAVVPNQEVVIKHIGPQLARLAGVAGATVLGNGDIVLILNPVPRSSQGPYRCRRRTRRA